MKFPEFVELKEVLEARGYKMEELKEELHKDNISEDKLFEIFGIKKALLSWGASKMQQNQMKKKAGGLKEFLDDRINQYLEKIMNTKKRLTVQIAKIKNAGKPVPEKAMKTLMEIEQRIIKIVDATTDKLINLKTKEVNVAIQNSKKLTDKAKIGMEYFWEEMMSDLKVEIVDKLFSEKVLNLDASLKWEKDLKRMQNGLKDEALKKLKKRAAELKNKDKDKEEDETKDLAGKLEPSE